MIGNNDFRRNNVIGNVLDENDLSGDSGSRNSRIDDCIKNGSDSDWLPTLLSLMKKFDMYIELPQEGFHKGNTKFNLSCFFFLSDLGKENEKKAHSSFVSWFTGCKDRIQTYGGAARNVKNLQAHLLIHYTYLSQLVQDESELLRVPFLPDGALARAIVLCSLTDNISRSFFFIQTF